MSEDLLRIDEVMDEVVGIMLHLRARPADPAIKLAALRSAVGVYESATNTAATTQYLNNMLRGK